MLWMRRSETHYLVNINSRAVTNWPVLCIDGSVCSGYLPPMDSSHRAKCSRYFSGGFYILIRHRFIY